MLDVWRTFNGNTFHMSTILLKKLLLNVVVLTKFFLSLSQLIIVYESFPAFQVLLREYTSTLKSCTADEHVM